MDLVKDSHTAIFSGQTKCRKTHLLLNLLESEYKGHFEYIADHLSYPIWINKTYLEDPGSASVFFSSKIQVSSNQKTSCFC